MTEPYPPIQVNEYKPTSGQYQGSRMGPMATLPLKVGPLQKTTDNLQYLILKSDVPNFYSLNQSVPSQLKLELARAKKLELGWLGSARRQGQNPSLAQLGLEIIQNFRAELGLGLE